MTSEEITELQAFMSLEPPVGDVRSDIRTAHQTAILLNAIASKGRKAKLSDTLLRFDDTPGKGSSKLSDAESQLAAMKNFTRALGGTVEE